MRRTIAVMALAGGALTGLVANPRSASAQYVGGKVIESASGRPLAGLQVLLLLRDSTDVFDIVHRTTTDRDGFFLATGSRAGIYRVAFGREKNPIGVSGDDTLTTDSLSQREFRLSLNDHVFDVGDWDHPVEQLSLGFGPKYPERMRACRTDGEVEVRIVVDTAGRVEMPNVLVLRTTGADFTSAVMDFLPRARFVPAQWNGWKVRSVVQMPFTFLVKADDGVPWPDPRSPDPRYGAGC